MDKVTGFIGIDIGTQGLSVLFTDEDLKVLATGEGGYGFVTSEAEQQEGCYEQRSSDWLAALKQSMDQIHAKFAQENRVIQKVLAIGVSGQMHGEVLLDEHGQVLGPVRIWCDARNAAEGDELTALFQVKVPKRATCARFLWTIRNRPALARKTRHITTPAGWMALQLTGEYNLGIGDAAGMFPVDPQTHEFDETLLGQYNTLVKEADAETSGDILPLRQILPRIRRAGQDAGFVTPGAASNLLGLYGLDDDDDDDDNDEDRQKIPVASAEGDQVAALAGSLIGTAGTISCSFGTSVCANVVVGDGQIFQGASPAVDHFCACDGKPIHMVWLRNGTTFLNTIVESYGKILTNDEENNKHGSSPFAKIMPWLVQAPDDCGGLMALPFMDDEPGLGVKEGGSAMIIGWSAQNNHPGHVAKAALLSTIFNLKAGCQVLETQGSVDMREIVLTGGLVKTPACGQIVADVFNLPVLLLDSAEEGCCWGACVMAKYRYNCSDKTNSQDEADDWETFLTRFKRNTSSSGQNDTRFTPNTDAVKTFESLFQRYKLLMEVVPRMTTAMA